MKNILIMKFGALGDVVRTSFILPGLMEKYGDPRVWWLTSNSSFDLLRFNPYICGLFTPTLNMKYLFDVYFDLLISLDDEVEVLHLLKNFKFKKLIGSYLDNSEQPVYTDSASIWFDLGLISRYGKERADKLKQQNRRSHKELMELLLDIKIPSPIFFNSPEIEKSNKGMFPTDCFNIGINSGSGGRWPSKQLRVDEAIKLVHMLLPLSLNGKPARIFLLGAEAEIDRHNKIKGSVKSPNVIDTGSNNSLLEFAAIIKHLDYVISSDSLALHLAIAQMRPTLSFFSQGPPWEIETFGTGEKVLSTSKDFCSFRADADNSTITAERLYDAMMSHIQKLEGDT
ncbi:MAG: heptosyltransferase II [Nitrospirae bacterium]|nr:MAG: heptosyltransferase II [Nitrospirota bacterium]